jgi:biotin carboxylase
MSEAPMDDVPQPPRPEPQPTLVVAGPDRGGPIRLTAVVPCCDEADGIDLAYQRIATELSRYDDVELLFVDDGSTDRTLDRIKTFADADPRVFYLSFTRNFGLEAAFAAGFKYASKDWVVQLDADLQSPPAEVHKLMAKALEGWDVVFGIRSDRHDPLPRRLGSRMQHWFARRVLGIDLPQGASSFRVVRASVAKKIAAAELPMPYFLATVPRVGARWTVVPTEHRPRTRGRSKFSPGRLLAHSIELFVGFSVRPLAALPVLAAVLAAATALGAVAVATGRLGAAGAADAALAVGTLNLVTLAVIGGYLFRLVRGQPRLARYYVREANLPLAPEDDLYEHERGRAQPTRRQPATRAKSLVILGGGTDQVPAYKAARRLGCRVVGVDRRADAPAALLADRFLRVSTRDAAGILRRLGAEPVDGVLAPAGDAAHPSLQALRQHFATPSRASATATLASVDKGFFHDIVERLGFPRYGYVESPSAAQLLARAGRLRFPLVVKPADSSGSKGLSLVEDVGALPAAIDEAATWSLGGAVIAEELIRGRHFSAECFVDQGELRLAAISERTLTPPPRLITVSHRLPARLDGHTSARLQAMLATLCRGLEIVGGPVNFDFVVDHAGTVYFVEVGARSGGNGMTELIRAVYGVDVLEAAILVALGEPVALAPRPPRTIALLHVLQVDEAGVLTQVEGVELAARHPAVAHVELLRGVGSAVEPYTQAANKLGYVVVTGAEPAAAEAALAEVLDAIKLRVRPGTARQPVEGSVV